MRFHIRILVLLVISSFMASVASGLAIDPVKWTLQQRSITMTAGDTVKLKLKAAIDEGWHIYGLKDYLTAEGVGPQKTEITIDNASFRLLQKNVITSKPLAVYDSAFEVNVEKFKHAAEITLPISCSQGLKAGTYELSVLVYYQTCTSKNCLSPKEIKLPLTVTIAASTRGAIEAPAPSEEKSQQAPAQKNDAGSTDAVTKTPPNETQNTDSSQNDVPHSLLALILLAMGFGASSWVMPCVYPMIPITVSFFTKRAEKEHTKPIVDSLVYSAGIMSTYIVFGALAAIFFGATAGRDFASNPWVNLVLAALFIIIAGNLFGMYEIALPASLVNSLNRKSSEKKGYAASFIMGMVFSLTAFTCTVPFIDLVGKISAGGEWFRPILGMSFYSLVFALPFFLLALFPTAMTRLPRSGAWMNNIKVVFGFVEIAFAVSYFARTDSLAGFGILSREVVLSIWAACSFLIMLYILGVYKMKMDGSMDHIGGLRALLAVVFASLTFYIFDGIKSSSVGPLEPFVYVESSLSHVASSDNNVNGTVITANGQYNGEWIEDLDSAFIIARKLKRPVFIDFTGISCTNCRWMEKNMFPKPEVRALMQQMILVRAYTDRRYVPRDKQYQEMEEKRFHSTLLPLYVLLTPEDVFIASSTYTPDVQEFVSFLKKAVPGEVNISMNSTTPKALQY